LQAGYQFRDGVVAGVPQASLDGSRDWRLGSQRSPQLIKLISRLVRAAHVNVVDLVGLNGAEKSEEPWHHRRHERAERLRPRLGYLHNRDGRKHLDVRDVALDGLFGE